VFSLAELKLKLLIYAGFELPRRGLEIVSELTNDEELEEVPIEIPRASCELDNPEGEQAFFVNW